MCCSTFRQLLREYWLENRYKPRCWNRGFIIEFLKCIFGFFSVISPSRFISFLLQEWRKKLGYIFVDIWVLLWLMTFLFVFINNTFHFSKFLLIPAGWVVWLVSIRLAEIFQSWFSQFVLGGVPYKWKPVDTDRSLVLVFMGYMEIIIAYALLAYIYSRSFNSISCLKDALRYSIGNAIAIGSDFEPTNLCGYLILSTQLMFTLVFLTAVVQHIISYSRMNSR